LETLQMTSIQHNQKVNFWQTQIPSRLHETLETRCARPAAVAASAPISRGQAFSSSVTSGMNAGAHGGAWLTQGLDYLVGKGKVVRSAPADGVAPAAPLTPTGFNGSVQMQKGLLEPMLRVTADRGADLAGGVFGLLGGVIGVVPALVAPILPRIKTQTTKVTETAAAPAPVNVDAEAGEAATPLAADAEADPVLGAKATAKKTTVEGKVEISPSAYTSDSVLHAFSSTVGNAAKATVSAVLHGAANVVLFSVHTVTGMAKGVAGAVGAFAGALYGVLHGLVGQLAYRSPVDLDKRAETLQKKAAAAQKKADELAAEANKSAAEASKSAAEAKEGTHTVEVTETKKIEVPTTLTEDEIRDAAGAESDSEIRSVPKPVTASV
jgi:hypothetical protein